MRAAGIEGEIVTWDDALHDGPAPAGLSLEEFSEVRADFIARRGWSGAAQARRRFQTRDRALLESHRRREVVLWFEHDLYDQLQLIQILDWFAGGDRLGVRLSLAQSDDYLAERPGSELLALFERRAQVTDDQLMQAREAWTAFTSPDPRGLGRQIRRADSPLRHLAAALLRHLEEFPWTRDGLARSERQILRAVERGAADPVEIFKDCQKEEEPRYMGDWSFWPILERLHRGASPPLQTEPGPFVRPPTAEPREFRRQRVGLSEAGRAILAGDADQIRLNGCDRWLGGVRLRPESFWRWDPVARRLEGGLDGA